MYEKRRDDDVDDDDDDDDGLEWKKRGKKFSEKTDGYVFSFIHFIPEEKLKGYFFLLGVRSLKGRISEFFQLGIQNQWV